MAGDHKCPVCQSTFTRPQHVARHMRSHTGDRPYKCQHCGDQFARSDLLSRHINKCHASEKPPTTTAPSRRKGMAAASRATTSKQACDQCVTSSLPCDGANPCSKCVQRKCRCTYVKFHRQTAPAGPGHPVPPAIPPTAPGRHAISLGAPRLPDDFLLAPPPGTMNLSSLYPAGPVAHQYPLQQPGSVYSQDYTSLPPLATALAPSHSPAPGMLPQHAREALESDPELMARYRAQAELFSRASVLSNGNLALAQPAPSADTSTALPGLYAAAGAQDAQYNRYSLPPTGAQWDSSMAQNQYQRSKEYDPPYGARSQSHAAVQPSFATGGEPSLQSHPPAAGPSASYDGGGAGPSGTYHHSTLPSATTLYSHHHPQAHHPQPHHSHPRSEELSGSGDDFGSDAGSTSTGPSHSIPSSASSSAVHLPLPGFNNLRSKADYDGKEAYEQPRYQSQQGQPGQSQSNQEGEGGFSSAFGLMSLDDPNVLAGLSTDGAPFFSGINPFTPGANNQNSSATNNASGLSLATPTQDLLTQLKSAGGRDALDNKDMRDFWKMYLRTPLTGPNSSGSGGGIMFPLQTPRGPGAPLDQALSSQAAGRPSPTRRHSRVASLPSMKTPPLHADERLGHPYSRGPEQYDAQGSAPRQQTQLQQQDGAPGGVTGAYNSTVRTTLHDAEDLKSYEQAVLARKAPIQLNLVPKRKSSVAASSQPQPPAQGSVAGKSKSMSPVVPHAAYGSLSSSNPVQDANASLGGSSKISELLNRPASSSSAGTTASSNSGMSAPPSDASTANTSQASSSLAHAFGGSNPGERPATSDGQHHSQSQSQLQMSQDAHGSTYRPSFKRIASQTLGPDNAKRALLGPAGWDREDEDDDEAVAEEEEEEEEQNVRMSMSGLGGHSTGTTGMGEGRRMSLPTQG